VKLFAYFVIGIALSISAFAEDWQKFMLENSAPMLLPDVGDASASFNGKNPKAAFSWTFYAAKTNEGKRIEDEFHAYAEAHWSEAEYWRWIAQQSGIAYDHENLEALREWEHQAFSHGLHREKDQQYYEMIGKYHQFSWGWDDFRKDNSITVTDEEITAHYNETGELNPNRLYYEKRRDASNDAFKLATTGATIAVFNHLLSAIDAAWTTTKYNRRIDMSLRLEPIYFAQEMQTVLTLQMTW